MYVLFPTLYDVSLYLSQVQMLSHSYMHNRWIVNTGMQTCCAGLLSKSQVADTSAPSLPASMLAKWKCPVCFSFGKPPGVKQQGPVNYTPVALDLPMQNQCPFAASLFRTMLMIPPLQCSTSFPQVEHLNDHLERAGRISLSLFTLKALWEVHNCLVSTDSQ